MAASSHPSQQAALQTFYDILDDFDIPRPTSDHGPEVVFKNGLPPPEQARSEVINLSLVGAIPSLANAVAAAAIFEARGGGRQRVELDLRRGHNYIDPDVGMTPTLNGQEITLDMIAGNPFLRNIFQTQDGKWAVLSAVYVDLVYQWTALLDCSITESSVREAVMKWNANDLEALGMEAGMPMAICQTEKAWLEHPHGSHLAKLSIVPVDKISPPPTVNGATPSTPSTPFLSRDPERPLTGLKVITLTHAIAGPSTGRTLAEHGASVLQIMFTHGFEHAFVYTYANLGTASARLNLHKESDRQRLWTLVKDAHVWIDSYREGAISKFGFTDEEIWKVDPGMIITHVRCYGTTGPWAWKPGFDMQGSASSGMMYLMGEGVGDGRPQWLPGMVVNDYTTGYFGALAIMGIILKRCRGESDASEGWTVSPSLCGTAMGILKFFKTSRFSSTASSEVAANIQPALTPETLEEETPLGYLKTLAPLPKMSLTPLWYEGSLLQTMGSSKPIFPGFDDDYDVKKLPPAKKDNLLHMIGIDAAKRLERLRVLGRSAREKRD